MMLSAGVMGIFGIIFILLRSVLPALYIDDPQVILVAANLLIIAALFQMFDGTQAVGIGILRGIADTKIPMFITFIAYWVVGLPGGYLLGIVLKMGVEGVWIALLCSLLFSASMLARRFHIKSLREIII
jgi:MATE family multidrug resistance protein